MTMWRPMYVGWLLIHLGVGVAGGFAWIIAGLPAAAGCLHRQVLNEERLLEAEFRDEFGRYRGAVSRYQPGWWSFREVWPRSRFAGYATGTVGQA